MRGWAASSPFLPFPIYRLCRRFPPPAVPERRPRGLCARSAELKNSEAFRVLRLDALVRMKLTSFRDKDRVHLRDLIEVGLVDQTWCDRLPPQFAARLKELLDHPDG